MGGARVYLIYADEHVTRTDAMSVSDTVKAELARASNIAQW